MPLVYRHPSSISFRPLSPIMQRPTCTMLRVRSPSDAHVIFHAVSLNLLPIVARRLDTEERRAISSGCVFVWEERGSNAETTGVSARHWLIFSIQSEFSAAWYRTMDRFYSMGTKSCERCTFLETFISCGLKLIFFVRNFSSTMKKRRTQLTWSLLPSRMGRKS